MVLPTLEHEIIKFMSLGTLYGCLFWEEKKSFSFKMILPTLGQEMIKFMSLGTLYGGLFGEDTYIYLQNDSTNLRTWIEFMSLGTLHGCLFWEK